MTIRQMIHLLAALLACSLASAAATAKPRLLAVVVGVAGYTQDRLTPLVGAYNDAAFVAGRLKQLGAEDGDILLLIDRPTPAMLDGLPPLRDLAVTPVGRGTRAEIMKALADIAARARPGDEVVVTFSGHGFQQKERVAGSEPDGLDEIFLPLDSDPPHVDGAPHRNAIIDDEIGAALDAIRKSGANVTYIGDFCHSGDSTRGAGGGVPAGKAVLDPTLRTFNSAVDGALRKDLAVEAGADRSGWGSLVSMMAAPADTQAQQYSAPAFADYAMRRPQGALTAYAMANILNPRVRTYRDLANRITSNISQFHAALNPPRPLFDGALDRPLLGGLAGNGRDEGAGSWTVLLPRTTSASTGQKVSFDGLPIEAGLLDGLTDGSIVSLSMTTQDGEKPLLYGEVTGARATQARLKPAGFADIGAERWSDIRDARGRPFTTGARLVATLVRQPVPVDVSIAMPTRPANPSALQQRTLEALASLRPDAIGARLVPSGNTADLSLRFDGDKLRFVDPAPVPATRFGAIDLAVAARGAEADADRALRFGLSRSLLNAARFHRLRRVLLSPNLDGDSEALTKSLAIRTYVWRPSKRVADDAKCPAPPLQGYSVIPGAVAVDEAAGAMTFRRCDALFVEFENRGKSEVYVSPLIFSPDGRIFLISAKPDRSARFGPNEKGVVRYLLSDASPGAQLRDDLFLLVSDAQDGAAPNFEAIAQACAVADAVAPDCGSNLPAARTMRGGGATGGGLAELIDAALLNPTTRGAGMEPTRTGAVRMSWRTVP